MRSRYSILICIFLAINLCLLPIQIAEATFTVLPILDVTPKESYVGITVPCTVYIEDHDPTEVPKEISVLIPAGFTVSSTYLTNVPGIEVGTIDFYIELSDPFPDINLVLYVRTTDTVGVFGAYLDEAFDYASIHIEPGLLGVATLTPPTESTDGQLTSEFSTEIIDLLYLPKTLGVFVYQSVEFRLQAGVLINPRTPGFYMFMGWVTGAAAGSEPQQLDEVIIEMKGLPVGGIITPSNEAGLLLPLMGLGLVALMISILALTHSSSPDKSIFKR